MLAARELERVLAQAAPRSIYGSFSRCVEFRHLCGPGGIAPASGPAPLWGMGSLLHGGRFTPKGAYESVYLAEDPITALAETLSLIQGRTGAFIAIKTPPLVHINVDGVLTRVLDLTDSEVQEALGTNLQELTGPWRHVQIRAEEAPTQTLGRICHDTTRFDSIRYPSSKKLPDGVCLAVFPDRLQAPAQIRVFDPYGNLAQRLP